jgi:Protein of unknown function (DUF2721)
MENPQLLSALQTVISPVILISGIGMLVLSMTNRFSHTADRERHLADQRYKVEGEARRRTESQIRILHRRLRALLLAIGLALGSVLLAALLILTLFATYLLSIQFRAVFIVLFTLTLLSLILSVVIFMRDMSLALKALEEELPGVL